MVKKSDSKKDPNKKLTTPNKKTGKKKAAAKKPNSKKTETLTTTTEATGTPPNVKLTINTPQEVTQEEFEKTAKKLKDQHAKKKAYDKAEAKKKAAAKKKAEDKKQAESPIIPDDAKVYGAPTAADILKSIEAKAAKENAGAKATIPPAPKETEATTDNIDDLIAKAKEVTSETVAQTAPQPIINDPNFQQPKATVSESELANYAGVFLKTIEESFRYRRGLMTVAELNESLATPNYPFTYRVERNKEKPIEMCVILISGDVEKRIPSIGWLTINS